MYLSDEVICDPTINVQAMAMGRWGVWLRSEPPDHMMQ